MKVEGLKALETSLRELQKEYGGKAATQAMRPSIKAAMTPVEDTVKNNTPVDTGTLRDSIKVKIGKPTKKMLTSAHYNSTTIIYGQVGWFWRNPSLWDRALAVEYGTRDLPASIVLRSAMDVHHQGMINRFKDTLAPSIEKKAKQLAKKRSKV